MADPILSVRGLSVGYLSNGRPLRAVESVSFDLQPGETLGLVGESGSGKSTLIKGMLRVLAPPGVILGGAVHLGALSVLDADEAALRAMRWRDVSIVPQSALNALNPVLSIGAQMVDTMAAHASGTPTKFRERAGDLLELVGLRRKHLANYPHQLSGGMRQRVALALALALDPPLIVMDEPTTALDVIVESQILERVKALQAERGFAMLFITHDLPLLLDIADRVGVLYSGRMVELASVERIRAGGTHPYTRGLLAATPPALGEEREPLSIPGAPPSLAAPPPGCRFHPRCPVAVEACMISEPALVRRAPEQQVACHVEGHDAPDSKEVPGR